jgi:uncharacterized membrane protein YhaH (DUF805 family)
MEFVTKLEKKVISWFKSTPDLPAGGRKWLGDNVWWLALVGAILSGVSVIFSLFALTALTALMGTTGATYYVTPTVTSWAIVTTIVALVFTVLKGILLAMAVQPLKEKQKKGWVLLFATWLLSGVAVVVNSLLTLSIIGFIFGVLFGAVWLAILGYFLIEIHGEFAHVERSAGVKKTVNTTK